MKLIDGQIIYSPTDLVTFFQSPYISWINHFNLLVAKEQRITKATDPAMALLSEKGNQFEFAELKKMTGTVAEISRDVPFEKSLSDTLQAMNEGKDVIYQGALRLGSFQGYTDFLKKVPGRASKLGDYSYEIYDTKLAQTAKPTYAVQLNCYNEMLNEVLGHWPVRWHLILGNGKTESFLTNDFRYYYAHFKAGFLKFHAEFDINKPPVPESWESVIGFEDHIEKKLKAMDHLCTVAGMGLNQIRRLNEAGIRTRADFAKLKPKDKPKKMQKLTFERLLEQAQLQIKSEAAGQLAYRVLEHREGDGLGLVRLPQEDDGDVMFDMEGDPFAETGLEYLFGVYFKEKGKWVYKDWRATDVTQEKAAFAGFIEWIMARLKKYPGLHVYHYANYEKAAISNLSNKYSCLIAEVDKLLRDEIFVDLYQAVKEGVRIGAVSYSIKKLEPLYAFKRSSSVTNAGDSVVQFSNYCGLKPVDPVAAEKIFADIVEYNREDVVSTLELLKWMRARKEANDIDYAPPPPAADYELEGKDWEILGDALLKSPPAWIKTEAQARLNETVAGMAGYFQREDRPVYWAFFKREDAGGEPLYDDAECLALADVKSRDGNVVTLSFDPGQPLKLKEGARMSLHGQGNMNAPFTILKLDLIKGYAEVQVPKAAELAKEITLIPGGPINTRTQKKLLLEMAANWHKKGEAALTPAALDLLYRRPARVKGLRAGAELYSENEKPLDAALRLVSNLDHSSLSIQGPPGTGKTFTGAHIICHLLKAGKRVGVVAQGKQTVENLLLAVTERWAELKLGGKCPAILMAGGEADEPRPEFTYLENTAARKKQAQYQLVGATHWVFAHPDVHAAPFDYLFIDEAGQFSLTAAVASSYAAKNIVLLGDQMQLEQVTGVSTHPGDCGMSVLNYYMKGMNTVLPTHGVFLDETWRMHPSITDFISEMVYEKRLKSHGRTKDHKLSLPSSMGEAFRDSGILFLEVDHDGNAMKSEEEAQLIADLVGKMSQLKIPHGDGTHRKFNAGEEDLIIITPYNAQVELIRSKLPKVKVGSVDLFQGQEAWISIFSMCASGEEGLNRGLDFLLSKNRMNVGLSRAKALSIVVGSPRLLNIRPTKIGTIPLLNFYAGLLGLGK